MALERGDMVVRRYAAREEPPAALALAGTLRG